MEAINNGRNIKMKASKCLGRWIKEMKNEIRKGKEKIKMEKRINIQRNTQKNKKNDDKNYPLGRNFIIIQIKLNFKPPVMIIEALHFS